MRKLLAALIVVVAFFSTTGCRAPSQNGAATRVVVKQLNVNGVSLAYLDQGEGVPVVFVHGAISDHRAWIYEQGFAARDYRFIALDQRYFGTGAWPTGGPKFSVATHIDDLAAFIRGLNAGPVRVVGWSYSGGIVLGLALENPNLVRSVFVYEPSSLPALVTEPADMKIMKEESKGLAPAITASKAGDVAGAARQLLDWVDGQSGVFDTLAPPIRSMLIDNARTLPLMFAAPPPPPISCAELGGLKMPVTIAVGQSTRPYYRILSETASRCIPGSRLVVIPNARHLAPFENPSAFNDALLAFLKQ
ncbi:alpha/beta fold hydrolase [Paraburkholderia sp. CNPSo 3157]|uniref:Alpha/beta fold hydrolase n=1 Tax=Paraburkholderia franconis TaxID=2654983 RepID=A0A7X1NES7_9BURK|nr:alpha/beta hydrolase [Paraburkholderia franconis]MPW20647.1 alpha/beta fold hydrolase [Paraburkholderia franconis]